MALAYQPALRRKGCQELDGSLPAFGQGVSAISLFY